MASPSQAEEGQVILDTDGMTTEIRGTSFGVACFPISPSHADTVSATPFRESVREKKMLGHCKDTMREALTRVPAAYEERSAQAFRDILVWMGERPTAACQRAASREAFL